VQDKWGWELPGALIDEGEEPSETAVRELGRRIRPGGLMARMIKEGVRVINPWARHIAPHLAFGLGAGDENRTRTISLGS
jgi:ADP-ribose pyrophosphatase YjhB (NUDIX family)